jgi:hypothetical protein
MAQNDPAFEGTAPAASFGTEDELSAGEIISRSMFLDVYAAPSEWQELSIGDFRMQGRFMRLGSKDVFPGARLPPQPCGNEGRYSIDNPGIEQAAQC